MMRRRVAYIAIIITAIIGACSHDDGRPLSAALTNDATTTTMPTACPTDNDSTIKAQALLLLNMVEHADTNARAIADSLIALRDLHCCLWAAQTDSTHRGIVDPYVSAIVVYSLIHGAKTGTLPPDKGETGRESLCHFIEYFVRETNYDSLSISGCDNNDVAAILAHACREIGL